ncbi:MAG: NB-ARC domain-containing protein [Chloroflexota bacterium]
MVKTVIDDINRSAHYQPRYKLIAYAYEDCEPRPLEPSTQVIAKGYLLRPEAADIFISLLWLRMGTPTESLINPETAQPYQSATEYEFMTAYRSFQKTGKPLLLLYHCNRPPASMDQLDTTQFERVRAFLSRFGPNGPLQGMVGKFTKRSELKRLVRRDLEQFLQYDLHGPARTIPPTGNDQETSPVYFLPNNLPTGYIKRTAALDVLRMAMLGSHNSIGLVAAEAVADHGKSGLGKTVLARAICNDPSVRSTFQDGILWATLGQESDPSRHQRDWIAALSGDVAAASNLNRGKAELKRLLENRAMLLVLDDVWDTADIEPLRVGGSRCRVLLTTWDQAVVAGTALVALDVMLRQESRDLLIQAASGNLANESLADEIGVRLQRLPLALKIVGALLATGQAWSEISAALDDGDAEFSGYIQRGVFATIKAGVAALAADDLDAQKRFYELVVFPQDEPLVESAVARLWEQTAGLTERQTRVLLAEFRTRALVQADNSLHTLQHEYLRWTMELADAQSLHSALADSYGGATLVTALPSDDNSYGLRWQVAHLAAAGRAADILDLLTDVTFLQTKIDRLGTAALLLDFALLTDDNPLQQIAGALRLGAPILDREPDQLPSQLYGRLGTAFTLHNQPRVTTPHFRLESQTLIWPEGLSPNAPDSNRASPVFGCAFSPDGQLALSASANHKLLLWEVSSQEWIRTFQGHAEAVAGCAISPDGRRAVSASVDGTLRLWEVNSGLFVRKLTGHTAALTGCVFSPDGQTILSASVDKTLRLWDVASGQLLRTFQGHTAPVRGCAISPDGQIALSASADRTLRLWDVNTGQTLRILQGHTAYVTGCAFSPNGQLALSASENHKLLLWEVSNGRTLLTLRGHVGPVESCAISPNGHLALSASADSTLRLWDLTTGVEVAHWIADAPLLCCAYSSDGQHVIAGDKLGSLHFLRLVNVEA